MITYANYINVISRCTFLRKLWKAIVTAIGLFGRLITCGLYFIQLLDIYYNSELGDSLRLQNVFAGNFPPPPHQVYLFCPRLTYTEYVIVSLLKPLIILNHR